jgi:biopolymer transport protein ExbB
MELITYIDKGGMIMYILLGLNILGFTLMLFKFFQYILLTRRRKYLLVEIYNQLHNFQKEKKYQMGGDVLREKVSEYEGGLSTIKIIASIAPLLGLLGTVTGVLFAFEAISKQGLGDPTIFSSGISLALITTVGGLVVAIPHYIGYNYLIGMLDRLEIILNKELNQVIYKEHL